MVHSPARMKRHPQEKKPPEIVVQDFGEDMFDLGTPKDVEHMYKFVLSPRQSPASTKWSNGLESFSDSGKLKIPYGTNSCILFNASPISKNYSELESLDMIFQANGAEDLLTGPEKGLSDSFLMELGLKSPHSKVTLFSPKCPTSLFSENFLKEVGLANRGEVTLLSPKAPNLISTKTPVVVKCQNEDKCELGIYLPPCYTPALVDSIQSTIHQEELTMFPFPPVSDGSVSDCSHNDETESNNFFSCMQQDNMIIKAGGSSNLFEPNNNNNNNNNNNIGIIKNGTTSDNLTDLNLLHNHNGIDVLTSGVDSRHLNSQMFTQPGLCPVIQGESAVAGGFGYQLAAGSSSNRNAASISHGRREARASKRQQATKDAKKALKDGRVLHNDVERKRRGEMHSRFQKLRESIPELENDKKAAKITILKVAKRYIRDLEEEGRKMEQIKEYEKRRNRELLNRLCGLTGTSGVSA
ncbi:uncharacterized protein LOC135695026 [Rhopilema esculentum]|uniref:uncharacterized protein LOC135695026 n=1 Tax=Rhopilema esculentum TaxID=499914 RepID=UPI0031D5177C|eukprot:gene4690-20979_t